MTLIAVSTYTEELEGRLSFAIKQIDLKIHAEVQFNELERMRKSYECTSNPTLDSRNEFSHF